MTKKKEEVVEEVQAPEERSGYAVVEETPEQKQQRSDFMFALAGIRLECCKLAKQNNEVNLTRAEKLFQYVISGTK